MDQKKYIRKVFENAAIVAPLTVQIGQSEILRQKSKEVPLEKLDSPEIKKIIKDLHETLGRYKKLTGKGRGICAVQIGKLSKIAVLYIGKKMITVINPVIKSESIKTLRYPEICMSANPVIAFVLRPAWVEVEYLNEFGEEKVWDDKEDKIINRVFQHEIDHMEGIINIDLVKSKDLIFDSSPDILKNAKFEEVE
jgi:peptide deformylase